MKKIKSKQYQPVHKRAGNIPANTGGIDLKNHSVTKSLTEGSNTVNHNKGTKFGWTVKSVTVWDGDDMVQTEVSIINSDSINVILAGGSITDARIEITFK